MNTTTKYIETPGADKLHTWWGLSYASYLTIPRTILQSMPDDWQNRFAELLEEAEKIIWERKIEWPPKGHNVCVQLRNSKGKFCYDDLADYQRGRRRLWKYE